MPKHFVGENFCAVFQKVSGSEKLYGLERGSINIFRQNIFVSQCRKLSQLNPSVLCFRKLPVAKKIMDKRGSDYHDFPSKLFCLTMPKNFAGEPFCAVFLKISGSQKDYGQEGGYQDFPSENFCLTLSNSFVGEPFCVLFQKSSSSGKFYG